jgi:hypothetical protein
MIFFTRVIELPKLHDIHTQAVKQDFQLILAQDSRPLTESAVLIYVSTKLATGKPAPMRMSRSSST